MAELARFLTDDASVDARVASYMTKQLRLESVTDFAHYWTFDEYERGAQDDVVSQIELFRSKPEGELQVERLRAAWQRAQQRVGAAHEPRKAAQLAPVVPRMGLPGKTGLELGGPHTVGGRTDGTGSPSMLEAHEISDLCQVLLGEARQDKTLSYNNFTDPCPQLTKPQVLLCKGFDYGDKTLRLPCGPLPWPAGFPHPGYVPKTNAFSGRWITISAGQTEFVKAVINAGLFGKSKTTADVETKVGGMYLCINQRGDTFTVDASVVQFARAKRTFKSSHYYYEPLVSGGNLLGTWVLAEEYRKIGFFWDMDSGRCFRIERRVFQRNGFTILRQSTEVAGKISFVFYLKVSDDPETQTAPVQSRDYTCLAGRDNVPDNLGNPYPCTAKDLDYPVKKDTWLGKHESRSSL